MFKKVLSAAVSLLLAGAVALPTAFSAANVPEVMAQTVSTSTYDSLKARIDSLPKAVNYTSYKYVRNTEVNFSDGKYVFYNPVTNTIMPKKIGQWSSIDTCHMDYVNDLTCFSQEEVPSECIYTLRKISDGKYYIINEDGRYMTFPYYGIMGLKDTPVSWGEFTFEKAENTENLCFIISTYTSNDNTQVDLDMYASDAFTVHSHDVNSDSHRMQLYRQVVDVSINNDTTSLYTAIKNAQHCVRYVDGLEGTLDRAITDYQSAYQGGISQSTLDADTNELNRLTADYLYRYESDKTVFENKIRQLFDASDYKCLTLSSADLTAISQEAPYYDLSDEAAYLLERALGVKKRRFPTTKAGSSSPRGRGTCARSAMMSCSWPMWAPTGQLPGSGHRLRNPENLCPGKRE